MIIIAVMAGAAVLWNMHPGVAQDKAAAGKYEYGIVKWDGPDQLFYNLPEKFELVRLAKSGVQIPHDAQEEEWCVAHAANQMARGVGIRSLWIPTGSFEAMADGRPEPDWLLEENGIVITMTAA